MYWNYSLTKILISFPWRRKANLNHYNNIYNSLTFLGSKSKLFKILGECFSNYQTLKTQEQSVAGQQNRTKHLKQGNKMVSIFTFFLKLSVWKLKSTEQELLWLKTELEVIYQDTMVKTSILFSVNFLFPWIKFSHLNTLQSAISFGSINWRCPVFFLSDLRSNFFPPKAHLVSEMNLLQVLPIGGKIRSCSCHGVSIA